MQNLNNQVPPEVRAHLVLKGVAVAAVAAPLAREDELLAPLVGRAVRVAEEGELRKFVEVFVTLNTVDTSNDVVRHADTAPELLSSFLEGLELQPGAPGILQLRPRRQRAGMDQRPRQLSIEHIPVRRVFGEGREALDGLQRARIVGELGPDRRERVLGDEVLGDGEPLAVHAAMLVDFEAALDRHRSLISSEAGQEALRDSPRVLAAPNLRQFVGQAARVGVIPDVARLRRLQEEAYERTLLRVVGGCFVAIERAVKHRPVGHDALRVHCLLEEIVVVTQERFKGLSAEVAAGPLRSRSRAHRGVKRSRIRTKGSDSSAGSTAPRVVAEVPQQRWLPKANVIPSVLHDAS